MIVYGKQIFNHILKLHPDMVNEIILGKQLDKKEFDQIRRKNIKITIVDTMKAQALARGGNHQGYFLDIKEFESATVDAIKKVDSLIVLSGITDMGNIGAIVRTAYALGAGAVVVCGINDLKFANIIRSSSGAALEIPIIVYKDILDFINILKTNKFTTIATTADGSNVKNYKKDGKIALILGNEGEGLSTRVQKSCDERLSIVMKGDFDSLNVSNAAAILMDRILND